MNNAAAELKSIANLDSGHGDASVFGQALPSDSVVRSYLSPIKKHMQVHGATEVWINKPGELIIQLETGDITVHEAALTFAALEAFAQAGVDLFSLSKVTVGNLALAWGWFGKRLIPLNFLFTFQSVSDGVDA